MTPSRSAIDRRTKALLCLLVFGIAFLTLVMALLAQTNAIEALLVAGVPLGAFVWLLVYVIRKRHDATTLWGG